MGCHGRQVKMAKMAVFGGGDKKKKNYTRPSKTYLPHLKRKKKSMIEKKLGSLQKLFKNQRKSCKNVSKCKKGRLRRAELLLLIYHYQYLITSNCGFFTFQPVTRAKISTFPLPKRVSHCGIRQTKNKQNLKIYSCVGSK